MNAQYKALKRMYKHIDQMLTSSKVQVDQLRMLAQDTRDSYCLSGKDVHKGKKKKKKDDKHISEQLDPQMKIRPVNSVLLAEHIETIANRMNEESLTPFAEKCAQMQSQIKEYLKELKVMIKSKILKERHKRLLDYEMYERKYNALSKKPQNTSKEEVRFEEAQAQYEAARDKFEEVDKQAKQEIRQVIMKRYSILYPVLVNFYGSILAEYYADKSRFARKFMEVRTIQVPEPLPYEMCAINLQPPIQPYSMENAQSLPSVPCTVPTSMDELPSNLYSKQSILPAAVNYQQPPANYPPPPSSCVRPKIPSAENDDSLKANVKFNGPPVPSHLDVSWYYIDRTGKRVGPITFQELKKLKEVGEITLYSQVYNDEMPEWMRIENHPELPLYI